MRLWALASPRGPGCSLEGDPCVGVPPTSVSVSPAGWAEGKFKEEKRKFKEELEVYAGKVCSRDEVRKGRGAPGAPWCLPEPPPGLRSLSGASPGPGAAGVEPPLSLPSAAPTFPSTSLSGAGCGEQPRRLPSAGGSAGRSSATPVPPHPLPRSPPGPVQARQPATPGGEERRHAGRRLPALPGALRPARRPR